MYKIVSITLSWSDPKCHENVQPFLFFLSLFIMRGIQKRERALHLLYIFVPDSVSSCDSTFKALKFDIKMKGTWLRNDNRKQSRKISEKWYQNKAKSAIDPTIFLILWCTNIIFADRIYVNRIFPLHHFWGGITELFRPGFSKTWVLV